MNKPHLKNGLLGIIVLSLVHLHLSAQTPAFNQNSSRSNRNQLAPGINFQIIPQYGITLAKKAADTLFFRGNGPGFTMNAGYSFGHFGIGLTGGFISSQTDKTKINEFISRTGIPTDQMVIGTGSQQNMYVLVGPNAEFGKRIHAGIHARGGLFINNSGFVNIQRQGAVSPVYRNEPSSKSVFPGFIAGVDLNYKLSDIISLGFGADYLTTKSEIVNYDTRRGSTDKGIKLSKSISDLMAGISIKYDIRSPRDAASGLATGKRSRETGSGLATGKRTREAGSGMATGKRQHKPITFREAGSGLATGKRQYELLGDVDNSCGEVTIKRTNTDGSTEEMIFACPNDAVAYARQTPKTDFGTILKEGNFFPEKEKSLTVPYKKGKNIISGTVVWNSSGNNPGYAIVTNSNTGHGTKMNIPPAIKGIEVAFSARETGSGMATGKRSREKGSGMATGRRQYEPVFNDGGTDVCNPCLVSVKSNPLYNESGNAGTNPLHENKRLPGNDNGLCGTTQHLIAILTDTDNGEIIARTSVEPCGDFWFANVPDGNYTVRISGELVIQRQYDVIIPANKKMDIAGSVAFADDWLGLIINSSGNNELQKAGISTSRSNIRRGYVIIDADTDGDGNHETIKVLTEFSDGSTKDITADAIITKINSGGKKVVVRGRDPEIKEAINGTEISNAKEYEISIGDLDGDGMPDAIVSSQKKGSLQQEKNILPGILHHPNVVQYVIPLSEEEIWSPRSNIKRLRLVPADMDGDGRAETIIGGAIPGAGILGSARTAGDPIHGVDVKLGNTAGKVLRSTSTNEDGEFEFTHLDAENYFITIEQTIIIEDQTFVSVGNNTETMQTRAQDYNSSRSNKTASVVSPGPDNAGNTGGTKAQDYNSSRSNKSASVILNDPGNGDQGKTKPGIEPVKWMAPEAMQKRKYSGKNQLSGILASLDELEQQLNDDESTPQTGVNTSRSNIKNQRAAIYDVLLALDNLEMKDQLQSLTDLEKKADAMNIQFLALQESTKALGQRYSTISNVLKTKHDIAMNSIRNMK